MVCKEGWAKEGSVRDKNWTELITNRIKLYCFEPNCNYLLLVPLGKKYKNQTKSNFKSFTTEPKPNYFESNRTVLNLTELFQFNSIIISNGSIFFFSSVHFKSSQFNFLVNLFTPSKEYKCLMSSFYIFVKTSPSNTKILILSNCTIHYSCIERKNHLTEEKPSLSINLWSI